MQQNRVQSTSGNYSGPRPNQVGLFSNVICFVHILTYTKPPAGICLGCGASYRRRQELERHILFLHLPCWIWCPYSGCAWRGHRVDDFKRHLDKQGCGPRPEEREYQIYNVKMVLDWIKDSKDANSMLIVQNFAVDLVKERATELGKNEWLENPWGHSERRERRLHAESLR